MLTPFTDDNKVDYESLGRLTEWYIRCSVSGLFAVCQSSEMFFLSDEERTGITRFVKEKANGRVPVIASGHISDSIESQAKELKDIASAGADCLILLTNRLAKQDESDDTWLENLKKLLALLPEEVPLGFYECPFPYKRLISPKLLKWCADTGRFHFIKDTSCDIDNMNAKLEAIKGTQLKLFNANSATLLQSLKAGASGFSGVMAGFQADLYSWVCGNFGKEPAKAEQVSDFLSVTALLERQIYPINAKYYQKLIGNFTGLRARTRPTSDLNSTAKLEVEQHTRLSEKFRSEMGLLPLVQYIVSSTL
jgi:4-hydroxy-tetrahydrodipicolinate synthase